MRARLGSGVQKDLSDVNQHRERAGLVIAFLTAASSNNVSFGEIGAHKRDKEEKNMTEILNVVNPEIHGHGNPRKSGKGKQKKEKKAQQGKKQSRKSEDYRNKN